MAISFAAVATRTLCLRLEKGKQGGQEEEEGEEVAEGSRSRQEAAGGSWRSQDYNY